ncbi:uncharacterized protein LOC129577480 isoform X1 [Sitodiplosis mosellana]|uniref:uncharacterized protein LOC129577480 isoform X1 n=1 Tax=Sitodiplosis mosellana TaxID=263140 RepID=UPI0024449B1E|nr:uncharacterized protein LOC129577480 isoform X1 [Sitodiplosis mosellana]
MPKRKGTPLRGNQRKKKKIVSKTGIEGEIGILAIKMTLKAIVRPQYYQQVKDWFTQKSIECTKICALASLLFLYKVKSANESNNADFFSGDGNKEIKDCFYAVLQKNKEKEEMVPDFRDFVENMEAENRFSWPGNSFFGNQMQYLYKQYTTNLRNNLEMHAERRLYQYLIMRAWQFNAVSTGPTLRNDDIKRAVQWTIDRYDPIKTTDRHWEVKWEKRQLLLDMIAEIGGPEDNDVAIYTTSEGTWFKSINMWLTMQMEVDNFHIWAEENGIEIPKIKNLKVIPIHQFMRQHVKMETDVLIRMMSEMRFRLHGLIIKYEIVEDPMTQCWDEIFDMPKIHRLLKSNKRFRPYIASNGQAVSIMYEVPKSHLDRLVDDEIVRKRYRDGVYVYEIGIDPGMRTWNATVRRNIKTGKEVSCILVSICVCVVSNRVIECIISFFIIFPQINFTVSSKRYHYLARQGVRDRKAKRWTRRFVAEEQHDRERYQRMPSPKGENWGSYIAHRLTMLKKGIETYTTEKYARLQFDKYIQSNRATDKIANLLTNRKPSIIHMGAVDMPANSPIRIKKHVRCPGNRKLAESFRKIPNTVVRQVNENRTSQLCGRCFTPFDIATQRDRMKVCEWCLPDNDDWPPNLQLPTKIVSKKSKRTLIADRQRMREAVEQDPNQAERFVSKVISYQKNWQQSAAIDEDADPAEQEDAAESHDRRILKTCWHRDITAAKLILYKGHCHLFGIQLHFMFTIERIR